jgi:hypothetical protein
MSQLFNNVLYNPKNFAPWLKIFISVEPFPQGIQVKKKVENILALSLDSRRWRQFLNLIEKNFV